MNKSQRQLKQEEQDIEDLNMLVVERHPVNGISIWSVLFFVAVIVIFIYISKSDFDVQMISDAILPEQISAKLKNPEQLLQPENIHQLISSGKVKAVERMIAELDKGSLNALVDGMPPIMLASSIGNLEIIDLLFTQGADPNKRGSMKRTALQYATEKNHIEAAKRLLAYGADIDAYDNGRLTPLIMAANRNYTELGLLFTNKGADVNIQQSQGWTALIDAAARNNVKLVKALLEAGASQNFKTDKNLSAMDYAKQYGHKKVVNLLENQQQQMTN